MRQLISLLAADFISPVYSSTTFEARDRPYVTILKSGQPTLVIPEPTLKFRPASSDTSELAGRISFNTLILNLKFEIPV